MQTPTRRQFGTAAVTTLAGGTAYLALGTRPAAAVTIGTIEIPDETYTTGDTSSIDAIEAAVSVNWEHSLNRNPKAREFRLRAGTTGSNSQTVLTETDTDGLLQTDSGQRDLRADILESNWLDRETLLPSTDGATTQNTVYVAVTMTLYDSADDMLGRAKAEASPTLTVTQESLTFDGSVSGSGTLEVIEA